MVRATRQKPAPITSVTVTYDLFDLPTAQHKAGLAGLILQIQAMKKGAAPEVCALTSTTATIRFTKETVQSLFDELYDSRMGEVAVRSKWKAVPKREEERDELDEDGKTRSVKYFVYDMIQPCGHFLRQYLPDGDGAWLKLWRDMLWNIPRGIPLTRLPFEDRLAKRPCREGVAEWQELVKAEQAKNKNAFHHSEVGSALWLGAQRTNAELIPFVGWAEQNLILHFWMLTALVFVPQQIDADGNRDFVGYVLAIPEVADLESFVSEYPAMLSQLSTVKRGYRPAEAVIDLPQQGALAFIEHLARLAGEKASGGPLKYSVGSVDFLHLAKSGNTIKTMASGRIALRPELLENYLAIVGRPGETPRFRNPLFRRGLMLALLNDNEWYEPMTSMLTERPWPFFVRSADSPKTLPWFWQDAATKFDLLVQQHNAEKKEYQEMARTDPDNAGRPPDTPLPMLIHRLVQTFVLRKTEDRSGMKWDDFKDKKVKDEKTGKERIAIPDTYREAKEKVASTIFLEMRSRREQDFVDHFTATFCSFKQFLPEDDFRVVAEALLTKPQDIKTLTLLALAANS